MMRTALVTGANRGIGLKICQRLAEAGHRVILSARDIQSSKDATAGLVSLGLDVVPAHLEHVSRIRIH